MLWQREMCLQYCIFTTKLFSVHVGEAYNDGHDLRGLHLLDAVLAVLCLGSVPNGCAYSHADW